ncbi:hypothetical protein OIU79_001934 [Salix purpurea]|uniref:Uncharacterized protein n=1 Tax=Salix purpurea TaxID=77065 RepID=A0A9Q0UR06_SALPP|nr:hypothetical protein OIU79_001934 [Salix purpurea]
MKIWDFFLFPVLFLIISRFYCQIILSWRFLQEQISIYNHRDCSIFILQIQNNI